MSVSSLHHGKSSSTGNLLEREDMASAPPPDYGMSSRLLAQSAAMAHSRQQRPYSMTGPSFSQVNNNNTHTDTQTHKKTHTLDPQSLLPPNTCKYWAINCALLCYIYAKMCNLFYWAIYFMYVFLSFLIVVALSRRNLQVSLSLYSIYHVYPVHTTTKTRNLNFGIHT
jgi:hypothetical protein